uniref:Uncharacterized protein n=1 Tax=Knipowitschia caucasica TaxID=637954 RepID=A0AAV2KU83_KNICA
MDRDCVKPGRGAAAGICAMIRSSGYFVRAREGRDDIYTRYLRGRVENAQLDHRGWVTGTKVGPWRSVRVGGPPSCYGVGPRQREHVEDPGPRAGWDASARNRGGTEVDVGTSPGGTASEEKTQTEIAGGSGKFFAPPCSQCDFVFASGTPPQQQRTGSPPFLHRYFLLLLRVFLHPARPPNEPGSLAVLLSGEAFL